MTVRSEAAIAGIYEHPQREIPDKSTVQVHAEVIRGALADAGIPKDEVDGLLVTTPDTTAPVTMADYLGMGEGQLSYMDSTMIGGSSYVDHVGHAAAAIAEGKASVAVVSLAGRPRSGSRDVGTNTRMHEVETPSQAFERVYGAPLAGQYAMAANRHMHEFGTTEAQLAEIRAAASHHAQYNENALYQDPVTVDDVLDSRYISDPLKLLDCCVITDGGGAVVVVSPDVAAELERECPLVLGHGTAPKHHEAGDIDLTYSGGVWSGERAYAEAGVGPDDVDVVCIYDSFTITVLETLEDLGFCERGEGGEFVEGGTLRAPHGELPFNTDGGGQCNNHPANQGGMTKVIECVRQLRGEGNEGAEVPDCEVALAHGTGISLGSRMGSATLVMGEEGYA